jgi:hypothetical protein
MLECYAREKHDAAPGVVIAVRLEHMRSVPHEQLGAVLYPEVTPGVVSKAWSFLGYDVANEQMRSALASVALPSEHRQALRGSVSPKLNE